LRDLFYLTELLTDFYIEAVCIPQRYKEQWKPDDGHQGCREPLFQFVHIIDLHQRAK